MVDRAASRLEHASWFPLARVHLYLALTDTTGLGQAMPNSPVSAIAMANGLFPLICHHGSAMIQLVMFSALLGSQQPNRPHLTACTTAQCPKLGLPLHRVLKTGRVCAVSKPLS